MANELRISYQGSGVPYAIIRRKSDWYVWNGSSLAAWSDGSVANYDIALPSQGGDVYAADFPAALEAGDYRVMYYESPSGSITTSDLILKSRDLYWNGEAATSDSDVDLSAYALTTLEGVKRHMQISVSTYDTLLTDLINQVSALIEHETGRLFKARDFRLRRDLRRERKVVLPIFPVQSVNRISYGQQEALSVRYSGSAIRANISVYSNPESADGGGVRLVTVSTAGVRTATALTFASYPSLSLLETAIEAASGWSATVVSNMPSADLWATAGESALNRDVKLYFPDQDEDSYTINQKAGIIEFNRQSESGWLDGGGGGGRFPCKHQGLMIEYRAGYETIPGDVELLCRELVKEAFYSGQQNTGLRSYALGPYRVDFKDDPTASIKQRIGSYIDVSRMVAGVG